MISSLQKNREIYSLILLASKNFGKHSTFTDYKRGMAYGESSPPTCANLYVNDVETAVPELNMPFTRRSTTHEHCKFYDAFDFLSAFKLKFAFTVLGTQIT